MIKKIYHSKYFPRLFYTKFDGGNKSGVKAFFLIEWKILFSIGILRFSEGSRENYHSHAFNACTWWLSGHVSEITRNGKTLDFVRSIKPKITKRNKIHKVLGHKTTWALTFRGRWIDIWQEYNDNKKEIITLTHGRNIINKDIYKTV